MARSLLRGAPMGLEGWDRRVGVFALLACTHCSGGKDKEDEPLEVRVLAAGKRIEVFTREPGDCHAFAEFRGELTCESSTWHGVPPLDCFAASCVSEVRVEQEGQLLARSGRGRIAAFELEEDYGTDAKLVIEGCGDPIELPLPTPKSDADLSFTGAEDHIELSVEGPAAGTFAWASSYAVFEGYMVACQTDTRTSLLPVSEAYSFYRTEAFAFDDPVVVEGARVRAQVFPSAFASAALSTQVDFGPFWDAAVAAAETSSLYQLCTDACVAATLACGDATEDVAGCAVPCVAAGEAEPNCKAEYQARVECAKANAACEAPGAPNAACEQAGAAWTACTEE